MRIEYKDIQFPSRVGAHRLSKTVIQLIACEHRQISDFCCTPPKIISVDRLSNSWHLFSLSSNHDLFFTIIFATKPEYLPLQLECWWQLKWEKPRCVKTPLPRCRIHVYSKENFSNMAERCLLTYDRQVSFDEHCLNISSVGRV